jgi:hypothetical protein
MATAQGLGAVPKFTSLWRSPRPVVAQVHGWCVGRGSDRSARPRQAARHDPLSQLAAMKPLVNQAYENMGLASTQLLGPVLDGLMRNTPEANRFIELARREGVGAATSGRSAVARRSSRNPRACCAPGRRRGGCADARPRHRARTPRPPAASKNCSQGHCSVRARSSVCSKRSSTRTRLHLGEIPTGTCTASAAAALTPSGAAGTRGLSCQAVGKGDER